MPHRPDFATFCTLAAGHALVPIVRRLSGDALTPVTAFARLREADRPAFLFESVVGGERLGRYSLMGSRPFAAFSARDNAVTLAVDGARTTFETPDPLAAFESLLARYRAPAIPGLPPFVGGAVGYAAYDVARYAERLPNAPPDDRNLPDLSFGLYDRLCIFDHVTKAIYAVAHARTDGDLASAYRHACGEVDALVEKLRTPSVEPPLVDLPSPNEPFDLAVESTFSPDAFEAAVRRAQEYIAAGDIFQVVLSQRFRMRSPASAFSIYRALRAINPSPFMFLLDAGPCTLVGASPEILARLENGVLTVRPLAGTRPRGRDDADDRRLADELLADPKERAEHVMLVDLGRNDVGRVSEYGSVLLADLLTVEKYSHVMHLSSTVTGRLRDGLTPLDALRACLPAGTLSGAPKVRAMEIIDELEPCRRGPYGGAVGHLGFAGGMDTCIALRTLVIAGEYVDAQAGAGVVADSVPAAERAETEAKARALIRAVAWAERGR